MRWRARGCRGVAAALGLGLLGTAWAAQSGVADETLPAELRHMLRQQKISSNALGLVILPLAPGGQTAERAARPLVEHAGNRAFLTGSTMKLVTAAAALDLLGPRFQWRTQLYYDGVIEGNTLQGNLYLKGGGDPTFTFEKLWLLLRVLRTRGVDTITGRVLFDRGYYPDQPKPEDDFDDQPQRAYNVGPEGLMLNFQAVAVRMQSDDHGVQLSVEPPLPGITVRSRQQINPRLSCERWRAGWQWPDIDSGTRAGNGQGGQVSIVLNGTFPPQCNAEYYLSPFDAATYNQRLFGLLWQEMGGRILGGAAVGTTPPNALWLAEQRSAPLAQVIRDMNKYSINLIARSLFLTLGVEYGEGGDGATIPASLTSNAGVSPAAASAAPHNVQALAQQRVIRWIRGYRWNWPEFVIENGSGLSREERITPQHMAELLQTMLTGRYAAELVASLPLLGLDGSLEHWSVFPALQGEAHLKTGTLRNTKAVAGVMRNRRGEERIVVAMINHPQAMLRGQSVLEGILNWVWNH